MYSGANSAIVAKWRLEISGVRYSRWGVPYQGMKPKKVLPGRSPVDEVKHRTFSLHDRIALSSFRLELSSHAVFGSNRKVSGIRTTGSTLDLAQPLIPSYPLLRSHVKLSSAVTCYSSLSLAQVFRANGCSVNSCQQYCYLSIGFLEGDDGWDTR